MTTNPDTLTSADLMRMIGMGPEREADTGIGISTAMWYHDDAQDVFEYSGPTFNLPADPVQIDQDKADANAVEYLRAWLRGKGYLVDTEEDSQGHIIGLLVKGNRVYRCADTLSRAFAVAVMEVNNETL